MAKEFGYESVEDFTAKNKANLLSQKERQSSEKLHQEILEKLVQENNQLFISSISFWEAVMLKLKKRIVPFLIFNDTY